MRIYLKVMVWYSYVIVISISLGANLCGVASAADDFYENPGFNPHREYFNQAPNEHIDPFTGNLTLSYTDIFLPGHGGLDLKIQRVYNSKIKEGYGTGREQYIRDSPAGLGWTITMGYLLNPNFGDTANPNLSGQNPVVVMPDGSQHIVYKTTSSLGQTRELWKYEVLDVTNGQHFKLTLNDGTTYLFKRDNTVPTDSSVAGTEKLVVSEITDTNANRITVNYLLYANTAEVYIDKITDTLGRVVQFAYSQVGANLNLQSITAASQTWTYIQQNLGLFGYSQLTEVRPPIGPSWKYTYAANYELSRVTYPAGATIDYVFGDQSFTVNANIFKYRVVTSRTEAGRAVTSGTWTYGYSGGSAGDTTTITSPCGTKEEYTMYGYGAAAVLDQSRWKTGTITKKKTYKGTTLQQTEEYTWDRLFVSADFLGEPDPACGCYPAGYDFDTYVPILLEKKITRDGKTYTTAFSNYDAYGNSGTSTETGDITRTVARTYNTGSANLAKHIINQVGSETVTVGTESFVTNYGYDANGNLTTRNQYGVLTTYTYDPKGNVASEKNARNFTTNFQYSNGTVSQIANPVYTINRVINTTGTIASETNGRGFTTAFGYDGLNRVTSVAPPLEATTTITYDNTGGTNKRVAQSVSFTQANYDGFGRVVGTNAGEGINTAITYDTCGRKTYQSYPYTTSNIGDNLESDSLGRATKVTHPDNKTVIYAFSGSDVSITNERGITTTSVYKAFGNPDEKRLISVADTAGTTSYAYNTVGSLTQITHPGGLTRSFSYDSKNFLASETHPEIGASSATATTYGRDAVGNLTSRTDPKGTTSFVYDALNRLTSIDYPGAADDVTITHDNADNRLTMSTSAASYGHTYDGINRLTQQTFTISGTTSTTGYGYDTRGNVTSLTYPTGRVLTYAYDTANRPTTLTQGGTNYATSVSYHPSGAMLGLTLGNNKTVSYTYDNRYRVKTIVTPSVLNSTYNYDEVGNVTGITDGLNASRTRSMGYDTIDRLTSAAGVWGTLSFGYDAVGNRMSKTLSGNVTSYVYAGTRNRVTSASGAESDVFSYDANGNMTGIRGFTLAYDFANRLTSVNSSAVSYTYDGDGKRIKKVNTITGKTTLYHYDRAANILVETSGTGTTLVEYVYLGGQHVAKIEPTGTPPSAPTGLIATATSTSQINLSWTASTGADHYEVQRSFNNGAYTTLSPNPTGTTFSESGLTSTTTYLYRVRAVNAGGTPSAYSNIDLATTIVFTNDPLVAGETTVLAQHLTELRQAVNAVRVTAGRPLATWGETIQSGLSSIKTTHVDELRANLNPALTDLGFTPPNYIDQTLTPQSTLIKKAHVDDIRQAVK